jgi:Cu2+-containing amine oxidase
VREMAHPIKDRIISELESLSQDQQQKLLDYVLSLKLSNKKVTSGKDLMSFTGAISKEDLAVMEKAIKEDCEQVDSYGW